MSNATSAAPAAPSGRKRNAKLLASGYSKEKRMMEKVALVIGTTLWAANVVHVGRLYVHDRAITALDRLEAIPAALLGVLYADFVSGLAHWYLDTWGTPSTFIAGPFIRSFREHHVDQSAITRHDFIETNGDNFLAIVPVLLAMLAYPAAAAAATTSSGAWYTNPLLHVFLVAATFAIALTNQAHKMSHQPRQPFYVKALMRRGIIMSPQHHRVHHTGLHDGYYCISTGWLNPILDGIGFWRGAERLCTALTGAIPRANDQELLAEYND